jgi:hypothetical protein
MEWDDALSHNGFSEIDIVLNDHPDVLDTASVILTTPVDPTAVIPRTPGENNVVWVVYKSNKSPLQHEIGRVLTDALFNPIFVPLIEANSIPNGANVISLVELELAAAIFEEKPFFERLEHLVNQASSILWVSQGDPVRGTDPTAGMMDFFST